MSTTPQPPSLPEPPRSLAEIEAVESSLTFSTFTATTAWDLGCRLRTHLLAFPTATVISISLANSNQLLFHSVTHPGGTAPDNDSWVARKRKTVLRWGRSTWWMHCKMGGDEAAFGAKYGLGESAGSYAIHGGGVPVRVKGVEGVVGVVVVSGLKQEQDHQVVVETIKEYLADQGS
ncbi:hypothetical protein W97_01439 [Coniosporium apollinis CBS 100218]|uniref:DUF967 domain protein n=1 Tax=Coniosporium apollinis (strain CBS 100218) TaxID=1168221 RepID=R7YK15_CONA1|nr:uncharacterized protein W97_01439 [Coniosporium apollinis CBS 100218]EON62218.1 hypothetical protein W97_01439 [Coniosporium apollinis CBS 100218]